MLFKIERKIDQAKQEIERALNFTRPIDMDSALNEFNVSKTFIAESLLRVRTTSEEIIDTIRLQEPLESATQDVGKLKDAIDSVVAEFESFQIETSSRLEKHRRLCIFREDIEKINSDLHDLNEHLKNIDEKIGDNLSASKAALVAFEQFEQTIIVS